MTYPAFDLAQVVHDFGLTTGALRPLFTGVVAVAPSPLLEQSLARYGVLGRNSVTEKARSEFLVAPVLGEVWELSGRSMGLLSGAALDVDAATGLSGVLDFVFTRSLQTFFVEAPLLVVVEAKRGDILDGLGQCAAELVAAQRFNQRAGNTIDPLFGCVTNGIAWRFLRLHDRLLDIDADEYALAELGRILGVFLHCCTTAAGAAPHP